MELKSVPKTLTDPKNPASKRDDKKAKKFIKPKKAKVVKKKKVKVEEKLSSKFDDDSLAVYGALLSESLDAAPVG